MLALAKSEPSILPSVETDGSARRLECVERADPPDSPGQSDVNPLGVAGEVWDRTPQEVREKCRLLRDMYRILDAENRRLLARVKELEQRLNQNSTNSSKPPSSDAPNVVRRARKKTGRRPGGQPGHPGYYRKPVPVEEVVAVDHYPEQCRCCGASLDAGHNVEDDGAPHQVTDLPPIRRVVTEHRRHVRECGRCGVRTRAELPKDIPTGQFGPGVEAAAVLLVGRYGNSRRDVCGILGDLCGVDMSVGVLSRIEETVSQALAGPVAEAHQFVQNAAVVNTDGTSWREGNKRYSLTTIVTPQVTTYHITPTQDADTVRKLLGEGFAGYVVSDRHIIYQSAGLSAEKRGACHSHIQRDFQKMLDRGGEAQPIGQGGLDCEAALFGNWHRFKGGELTREQLKEAMDSVQTDMLQLLVQGQTCGDSKTQNTCDNLKKLWPALWAFVTVPGVEPTNNSAERALRGAVIWRKLSFGTKTARGSRFVERILTVTETCRQQGRDVLEFLRSALQAARTGAAAPSLLPGRPQEQSVQSSAVSVPDG